MGFTERGRDHEQLSFLLVDEDVLIAQPVLFDGDRRGWWYCDLVTVRDHRDAVDIADLYVDVLVGPATAPYRVVDLDEFATAVALGAVDAVTARRGLESL